MKRWIPLLLLFGGLFLIAAAAYAAVPREALRYRNDLIRNARAVWGLSAPVATFAGQIHQESGFRSDARSRVGAGGLAQFMPSTAKWISGAYRDELGANDPFNPSWALRALVRYDRFLYDRVRAADSSCDRMLFALSGYNGGAGRVNQRQALSSEPGNFGVTSTINPGIHPANQRENADYPVRIVFRWQPLYVSWGPGVCT